MVEMFSTGDVSGAPGVVAAEYVDHQGLDGNEMTGVGGFVSVVEVARQGHTTLRVEVIDLEVAGDTAHGRVRWTGVGRDGRTVERETSEIVRVADGRAVEHWGSML